MVGAFIPWNSRKNSPGWIIQENGCHLWTGATNGWGYGRLQLGGRNYRAHVLRYEKEIGPVPNGMQLDHLCRNRGCGNPSHLEPVTSRENTMRGVGPTSTNARKTHCVHGHPLSGSNLKIRMRDGRPRRVCARCRSASSTRVSTVLQNPRTLAELPQDVREAIQAGLRLDRYTPSPHCPCERCHRLYRTIP